MFQHPLWKSLKAQAPPTRLRWDPLTSSLNLTKVSWPVSLPIYRSLGSLAKSSTQPSEAGENHCNQFTEHEAKIFICQEKQPSILSGPDPFQWGHQGDNPGSSQKSHFLVLLVPYSAWNHSLSHCKNKSQVASFWVSDHQQKPEHTNTSGSQKTSSQIRGDQHGN